MTTDIFPRTIGSGQPAAVASKPQRHSAQDQAIANAITEAQQLITKALANPEIIALLEVRGYNAAELQTGLALQDAAREVFNARPMATGRTAAAKHARDAAWEAARNDYMDFRTAAQVKLRDAAARKAVGAGGMVAQDLQKFITQAAASYTAALAEPYAAQMATRGWTAERLNAALVALPVLLEHDNKFNKADSEAAAGTSGRNTAFVQLSAWVGEFRKIASLALKNYPAHLTTLGL